MPGRGVDWRRAAIVIAAVALAYANSLRGPFIWDDQLTVIENPQIRSTRFAEMLSPEREFPVAGRPLVNATFALNYAIGNLNVTGYHVANVVFHGSTALLLFGLLRRALTLPRLPAGLGAAAPNLALAATLLWALHPLNTEAVNYITQRTELMMGFFYVLTMYASTRSLKVRATGKSERVAGGNRLLLGEPSWLAIAILACAAGMACKESMVTAPLMVVLFDAVLVFGSLRGAMRERWRFYLCLAATWGLLAYLMSSGPRMHSAGLGSGITPWTYLLNQPEIIADYLRNAIWPGRLIAIYGWPEPLTIAQVWGHGLLIVLLLAVTVAALVRWPPAGLMGAWFFITLAPASSIVPIATEVGAERRMYLPLMAIAVLVAVGIWRAIEATRTARVRATGREIVSPERNVWLREPLWFAIVPLIVALGATTFARNRDYESPLRLAHTSLDRRPNDVARHTLGVALVEAGRPAEGIDMLKRATASAPRAYYDLGLTYYSAGRLDESIAALEQFATRQPALLEVVDARLTMCRAFGRQEQWERSIAQCREVLRMSTSNGEARELLGKALGSHGVALVREGKLADALVIFRQAVMAIPGDPDAQRNLAVAYFDSGNLDRAAEHARAGLALRSEDPVMRDVLNQAAPTR